MKKHLLFLGAPGAGKGTQAQLISKENSYLHLSTGELLRKEIEMKTNLGIQVKDIINKGELVNDELVLEIVSKNLNFAYLGFKICFLKKPSRSFGIIFVPGNS